MSKIKSALELALERTADISVDKEALHTEELTRQGKTAAGQYLSNPALATPFKEQLNQLNKADQGHFRTGIMETLLANLSLPRYETEMERLPAITDGIKMLASSRGDSRNLDYLLNQLTELFRQFIQNLDQLETQLSAQWEGRLRQKEELLRQQTGRTVRLTPEQDPEYLKTLSDETARMEGQYTQILTQAKTEIRNLLG